MNLISESKLLFEIDGSTLSKIRTSMRNFFIKRSTNNKLWLKELSNRFPDVEPSILIDIKNDIKNELGID